jgi:hypothetical protein
VIGQNSVIPTNAIKIVERTQYYAKPGLAAEVLEQRRKASAVRVAIGLPAGEIFVKHPSGDGSEPDVAWQCEATIARLKLLEYFDAISEGFFHTDTHSNDNHVSKDSKLSAHNL